MKKKYSSLCFSSVLIIILFFCHPSYSDSKGFHGEADSVAEHSENTAEYKSILKSADVMLGTDLKRLKAFSSELELMKVEMFELRERSKVWDLDYYPPEEHDNIEKLLFRYLMLRNSLWEIVDFYRDYEGLFHDQESRIKGFLIGYSSGLHLINYGSLLVWSFLDEDSGKDKINEAYPRSEIPAGSYDMLFSQVTSVDNLEAIKVAWVLFSNERADKSSTLNRLYKSDLEYKTVIDDIAKHYNDAETRVQNILEEKSLLFPKTTNRLRHTSINKLAKNLYKTFGDNLYAIKGLLFANVGDIKMPLIKSLWFSQEQKDYLRSQLEPCDIILTYTSGYMSNIFLPGKFKHGIVYVGTSEQRKAMGLLSNQEALISRVSRNKIFDNLSKAKLESGHRADVVEAVAEGVRFNSLDLILDEHVNRIAIIRPSISEKEKGEALLKSLSLVGSEYDFKFDFNDGSYQCCTEVIFRSLNLSKSIDFPLTKRMGSLTLSASDILDYWFFTAPDSFEFLCYAEKNKEQKGKKAKIYVGEDGKQKLKDLMTSSFILSLEPTPY